MHSYTQTQFCQHKIAILYQEKKRLAELLHSVWQEATHWHCLRSY